MENGTDSREVCCDSDLLFGHLLYVVAWTGIIGNLSRDSLTQGISKLIKAVKGKMVATMACTFMTRANRSKQLPTAMSMVSPNILYRCSEYAITCTGRRGQLLL